MTETTDIQNLLRQAEAGNVDAQLELGMMYAEGRGVAQSDAQAVRWVQYAAEQGHARAQFLLGFFHETSRHGVEQSSVQAVIWWQRAAEQGHTEAMFHLGMMYARISHLIPPEVDSTSWLMRIVELGDAAKHLWQGAMAVRYVDQDMLDEWRRTTPQPVIDAIQAEAFQWFQRMKEAQDRPNKPQQQPPQRTLH